MNKNASTRIRGARLKFSLVWSGRSPKSVSWPICQVYPSKVCATYIFYKYMI